MANETKIDQIIDPKAIDALNKADDALKSLFDTYTKNVSALGSGIDIKVNDPGGLTSKFKAYDDALRQVTQSSRAILDVQNKQIAILNKIVSQTDSASRSELQKAKALKESNSAELISVKTENERIKGLKLLEQYNRGRIATEAEITAIMNTQVHTIAQAEAQNRALRAAVKNVSDQDADAAAKMASYNQRIDENTQYIQRNSDAMTQQKMNIGNYKSHWNGLGAAVNQVTREFPAFIYSAQTGFIAISNNLPILADQINMIRAENKALAAEGLSYIPVWQRLAKAIFSWQSLLSVSITLLTVYGKDVVDWVKNMLFGVEATEKLENAQKKLADAMNSIRSEMIEETAKLELLYSVTQDASRGTEERMRAVLALKKEFPAYFRDINNEIILNGDAKASYDELAASIIKAAKAKMNQKEIEEIADAIAKEREEVERLQGLLDKMKEGEKVRWAEALSFGELMPRGIDLKSFIKEKLAEAETEFDKNTKELKKRMNKLLGDIFTPPQRIEDLKEFEDHEKKLQDLENQLKIGKLTQEEFSKEVGLAHEPLLLAAEAAGITGDAINRMQEEYLVAIGSSDKYTKEGKKRSEERIKIARETEDALIELIAEGRAKERTILETDFERKIEDARRNEEDTTALVKALTEQRAYELAAFDLETAKIIEDKKADLRVEAAKKGSEEYFDALLEQLERQRLRETEEAEKLGADLTEIADKYAKKRLDVEVNRNEERVKRIQGAYALEAIYLNTRMEEEIAVLNSKYLKGGMKEQEYRDELLSIQEKYNEKALALEIELLEESLDLLSPEDRIGAEAKLSEARIKLINIVSENQIAATKREKEAFRENMEEKLSMAMDFAEAFGEFGDALFERQVQNIEDELEANKRAGEEKQKALEDQYNRGAISQAEYESRKRAEAEATEKKEEELEKKRVAMQRKQAIYQKSMDIAQAIAATALAVTKALPDLVLVGITAALGAVQIATIAAQPIPKYAKGTDYHKGGYAIVGDAGKHELVSVGGKEYVTPDTPTLVYMKEGAKVYPDFSDRAFTGSLIKNDYISSSTSPVVNINNDYSELSDKMDKTTSAVKSVGGIIIKSNKSNRFTKNTTIQW